MSGRKGDEMLGALVGGYSDPGEVEYCPYCGADICERRAGGMAVCGKCRRIFAVIEDEEDEEGDDNGRD